jgi:hypothetical protein
MEKYKASSLVPNVTDLNHPESVAWNKNGGRYDARSVNPYRIGSIHNMSKYYTHGRFRSRVGTVVYSNLPAHPTQKPRLVKHVS